MSEMKDHISFTAYGKDWLFTVWNSDVSDEPEDAENHFHGRLDGVESTASFTVAPNFISGMIIVHNDTFWIEALNPEKPLELFMYRTSDVWFHPSIATLHCAHTDDAHNEIAENMNPMSEQEKRAVITTYILADQYWVSSKSNPNFYTRDGTLSLLNDVNAVYASAGLKGFSFTVKAFGKYTLKNSWTTQGALQNMLNYFTTYSLTRFSPNYNTVAWLVGNNVGGLAWLSSACGAYGDRYRTAVAGLAYWSRLYTVKTIAHELGHNRGASHDFAKQCASNQASGCQCSVMSYCFPSSSTYGGAVNYFSSTSVGQIKATCN